MSAGAAEGSTGSTNPLVMLKLLRIPLVLMLCLVVIWVAFIGGSVQPTFEPYLKDVRCTHFTASASGSPSGSRASL